MGRLHSIILFLLTSHMTEQPASGDELFRAVYAAYNAPDIDAALALMTVDVIWQMAFKGVFCVSHHFTIAHGLIQGMDVCSLHAKQLRDSPCQTLQPRPSMTTSSFAVTHARGAKFTRGLRAFFEYRDLGIEHAGRMAGG